jgi:hypothetical protein
MYMPLLGPDISWPFWSVMPAASSNAKQFPSAVTAMLFTFGLNRVHQCHLRGLSMDD